MTQPPQTAEEGLLCRIERWAPEDAEVWNAWRESLSKDQRAESLFSLQAVLSGLLAFRHLENHPMAAPVADFRPHLHALRVSYVWALDLVAELRVSRSSEAALQAVGRPLAEPEASLVELERSLTDALRVSERLLDLPLVDAGAFQASCDLFLRDLDRNAFFRPSAPLEFSNVRELIDPESFPGEIHAWRSEAAKATTMLAFLTLLRSHRFLGIAGARAYHEEGFYQAQVVLSAVRKELRTLTRFLLVQGVETFADELEARLLEVDAHHITGARTEITEASRQLRDLRESVEALALDLHGKVRSTLDDPLPELDAEIGFALPAERMRSGVRELRASVKQAAKTLRALGAPSSSQREERRSERVQRNLQQDVWAFRFIIRAFLAKAAAASARVDDWRDTADLSFAPEFVRHFRVFGPRLTKGTGYERRGPLTRAVSVLSQHNQLDTEALDLAASECALFVEHLDASFDEAPRSLLAPFDKEKAAAELRGYLAAARDRSASERAAAGAFGLVEAHPAEAG
jgi:hypothetical protein